MPLLFNGVRAKFLNRRTSGLLPGPPLKGVLRDHDDDDEAEHDEADDDLDDDDGGRIDADESEAESEASEAAHEDDGPHDLAAADRTDRRAPTAGMAPVHKEPLLRRSSMYSREFKEQVVHYLRTKRQTTPWDVSYADGGRLFFLNYVDRPLQERHRICCKIRSWYEEAYPKQPPKAPADSKPRGRPKGGKRTTYSDEFKHKVVTAIRAQGQKRPSYTATFHYFDGHETWNQNKRAVMGRLIMAWCKAHGRVFATAHDEPVG